MNELLNYELLLKVPKGFDFIQTVDLFCKIHRVFLLNFHSDLRQVMNFLEYFVFGFRDFKVILSSRMEELNSKLFGVNNNNNNNQEDAELISEVENMFAAMTAQ